MRRLNILLVLFISVSLLSSCEKYEEGGTLYNAEKKISATLWKIESATDLEDGSDITNDFIGELWEFTEANEFKINSEFKGNYAFSSDLTALYISNFNGTEADLYMVDRLDKEALWLTMVEELELHFIPN
ncbi:MAG: hypothetical protein WD052_10930 [Bacteroidales bacterium]